ncbi:MAG: glycosyltransferase [Rhodoferax sp.]|uniref:glycosyltransferase family 2 protein n=1 Tax=Rhodoferax sp. TaxID=50421 RepID=UPI001B584D3A|nr:glycosyltransferase [Rhodoferax sp.]MBP9907082.1 glycosyltransferase [Rhodoferax sp.]
MRLNIHVITWLAAALYLGLLLLKAYFAMVALKASQRPSAFVLPLGWMAEVSILQPILSGDPHLPKVLEDNLRAMAEAHFFWLIDDDDAVAQTLTQTLAKQYPKHHIHIRCLPSAPEGTNPKSFKLQAALADVNTRVVLVLDDDARLTAAALEELMCALAQGDLATALPCYREASGLGGRLLAQFVNNNAAMTYLQLLPFASPISINGMCYALSTQQLKAFGGFSSILKHLTDDLAMARLLRQHQARLVQSVACVEVQTGIPDLGAYVRQMHRWFLFAILLLRTQSNPMKALIALLQGFHPWLLWLLIVLALGFLTPSSGLILFLVLLVRSTVLCRLQKRLTGQMRHRPLLSVISELLQPLHLLHATLQRTIRWRTRVYRVHDNDDFVSVS